MNELRAFKKGKRTIGDLTIIFWAKDTVYLLDEDHTTIIQRWFKVRNSWSSWRLMLKSYKCRKNLEYGQALGIAIKHGFGAQSARKVPDFEDLPELDWSKDEADN